MDNQKIAEWAGFKKLPKGNRGFHWECTVKVMNWLLPGKTEWFESVDHIPDFSNDLNACEKWIWPEILRRQGYWFELRSPYKSIPYCFIIGKHDEHEAWTLYSGESDNPATAVCLACEKLIGELVK